MFRKGIIMDEKTKIIDKFLNRISGNTCSFTTVKNSIEELKIKGFKPLNLGDEKWEITPGNKYYINIYDSSLFAFTIGENWDKNDDISPENCLRIAMAHTDQPALYVKSNPEIVENNYGKLNVEIYGGAILNTWMDRMLSVAGKVVLKSDNPFEPEVKIIDMERPLFTIPNLAIHLNRDINKGIELNKQTDMAAIACVSGEKPDKDFFMDMLAKKLHVSKSEILDYELFIYNCSAGDVIGFREDMISAPRIDNISSVSACLEAIITSDRPNGINVVALFDNEEIGSRTKQGADSETFKLVLNKLLTSLDVAPDKRDTMLLNSLALSVDVAHGYHPNKPEKSDPTNKIYLGEGIVIKRSSAQNYVTDSSAVATIMMILEDINVPYQKFASRSDMPQGGTLGSLASKYLPVKMVDMGIPILAMHSACELMAVEDYISLEEAIKGVFEA